MAHSLPLLFTALLLILLIAEGKSGFKKGSNQRKNKQVRCPKVCKCREIRRNDVTVTCRSSELEEVPKDLHEVAVELDLSMNNITKLKKRSFKSLQLLKKLRLSSNRIKDIFPTTFKGLHKLRYLYLSNNELKTIPDRLFADTPNIKELELDANSLEDLTEASLYGLRNLEFLHLDDNCLTRVPTEALRQTPSLKVLKLDVNKIEAIEDEAFAFLTKLSVLTLRENRLKSIGQRGLAGLNKLMTLQLTYNQLTKYPNTIKQLSNLNDLQIDDNDIVVIPDEAFSQNKNLKALNFENNPLVSVGKSAFKNLHLITTLTMTDILFQEQFPDLTGCASLTELTLTGGRISSLPSDLCRSSPLLYSLKVSNNRLYNLSGLHYCENLVILDASGNKLTLLEKQELKNLTKLTEVNLSKNDIMRIDEDAFEDMNLVRLNLAENSFSFLPVLGLRKLTSLNVSEVPHLLYLPPLQLLGGLRLLIATYPYHCCQLPYQPNEMQSEWEVNCYPEPGPLTPCQDLLPSVIVRVFSWLALVVSCGLNITILVAKMIKKFFVSRRAADRRKKTNASSVSRNLKSKFKRQISSSSSSSDYTSNIGTFDLALCHLAFSDLVTTLYLGIIVSYDSMTRGNFAETAAFWQQSLLCKSAGFFLVVGIQLSFFTAVIGAIERYLATMYPLEREKHIGKVVMVLSLTAAWVIAVATAVVTSYSGIKQGLRLPDNPLPPFNGATCLPWSTDFSFIAILVGAHLVLCLVGIVLCVLMYCARRKQSWLSAQKHTRLQISLTIACNVIFILPLALIGLLISAVATYPSATEPWLSLKTFDDDGDYFIEDNFDLNIDLLLMVTFFFTALRLLLNPILYIIFNQSFKKDCKNLMRKLFCLKRRSRFYDYKSDGDEGRVSEDDSDDFEFQRSDNLPSMHPFASNQEENGQYRSSNLLQLYCSDDAKNDAHCHPVFCDEIASGEVIQPLLHSHPYLPNVASSERCHGNTSHYPSEVYRFDNAPDTNPLLLRRHKEQSNDANRLIEYREDTPGPSGQDATLNNFAKVKTKNYNFQEAKRRLPPLVWQQYNQTKQSCESSTSKDSGIQSEPDFSPGAACSSGCSTFSENNPYNESDKKCNHSISHPLLPHLSILHETKQSTLQNPTEQRSSSQQDNETLLLQAGVADSGL